MPEPKSTSERNDHRVTESLWRVAQDLATEIVRRGQEYPFELTLLDGFRGLVLGAIVAQLDSREQAFRLVGREHLLAGRNHHRALKRELRKAKRLIRTLAEDVDPELDEILRLVDSGR